MQRTGPKAIRIFFNRNGGICKGFGGMFSPSSTLYLFRTSIAQNHSQPSPNDENHGRSVDITTLKDALYLFDEIILMRPLPCVVRFNQLLGKIVDMENFSAVISLYKLMGLPVIPTKEYTLNIMINCFCRYNHMGFSLEAKICQIWL